MKCKIALLIFCFLPYCLLGKNLLQTPRSSTLYFLENKGQITDQNHYIRNDIDFKLETGHGLNIFIGRQGLHYQWNKTTPRNTPKGNRNIANYLGEKPSAVSVETYRIDLYLLGANTHAQLIKEEKQYYLERYFTDINSNDYDEHEGVVAHSYTRLTYKNIYPNIDWVLYIKDNVLEYDFVLRPGARISDIQMRYDGASTMQQKADGGIIINGPMGNISENAPVSKEQESGKDIKTNFILNGNTLSFNAQAYKGTLIIDPQLIWCTYFGGTFQEEFFGIVADSASNIYAICFSNSTNNFATQGAFMNTLSGPDNSLICKFTSSGIRIWSTYYFNIFGVTWVRGICSDRLNNIYITGGSGSSVTNVATSNAFQYYPGGMGDAVLSKFDSSGARIWSTFYGGLNSDAGENVVCDTNNNVYLTGWTESTNGIATAGSYCSSLISYNCKFLAKFNSSGNRIWATYFGDSCTGSGSEFNSGMNTDLFGHIYLSGTICSANNITTQNAYQTQFGGLTDAYLAQFDVNGNLIWATYYGGNSSDQGANSISDSYGNVYLSGTTSSTNNIASANAYQDSLASGNAGFLVKFDSSGNRLWGTYINDSIYAIWMMNMAINKKNEIYLTGIIYGNYMNFSTPFAYQNYNAGMKDCFLLKWSINDNLLYATYYGGSNDEIVYGLCCDAEGSAYLCGTTYSTNMPTTTGAFQTTFGGYQDGFIAKWNIDKIFVAGSTNSNYCQGDSIIIPFFADDTFRAGNVFIAQLSDSGGSFSNPIIIATDTAISASRLSGIIPQNSIVGHHYLIRLISTLPADTADADTSYFSINPIPYFTVGSNSPICIGRSILFNTNSVYSGVSYSWSGPNGFSASTAYPQRNNLSYSDSGNYYIIDSLNGCVSKDTFHVSILPRVLNPTISANTPCAGDTLHLSSASTSAYVFYTWSGPSAFSSSIENPYIAHAISANAGTYIAIMRLSNGCADTLTVNVLVTPINPAPQISISANPDTICVGQNTVLSAVVNYVQNGQYYWKQNGVSLGINAASFSTGSVANGDVFICKVVSNMVCQPIDTAVSNQVNLHVNYVAPPVISISQYPANFSLGATMTYTAHLSYTNGLTFKWLVNGVAQSSVGSFFSSNTLHSDDSICIVAYSSIPCMIPDSVVACVQVGVGLNNLMSGSIIIYPNPIENELVIEGAANTSLKVYDVVGRLIYKTIVSINKQFINTIQWASGTYILEIEMQDGSKHFKKILKR